MRKLEIMSLRHRWAERPWHSSCELLVSSGTSASSYSPEGAFLLSQAPSHKSQSERGSGTLNSNWYVADIVLGWKVQARAVGFPFTALMDPSLPSTSLKLMGAFFWPRLQGCLTELLTPHGMVGFLFLGGLWWARFDCIFLSPEWPQTLQHRQSPCTGTWGVKKMGTD